MLPRTQGSKKHRLKVQTRGAQSDKFDKLVDALSSNLHSNPFIATEAPVVAQPPADAQNPLLMKVFKQVYIYAMTTLDEDQRITICVMLTFTSVDISVLVNINSVIALTKLLPSMESGLTQMLEALISE